MISRALAVSPLPGPLTVGLTGRFSHGRRMAGRHGGLASARNSGCSARRNSGGWPADP
jgi:hypothetical protein